MPQMRAQKGINLSNNMRKNGAKRLCDNIF